MLCSLMTRYQASETAGVWSIIDRLTREVLPAAESGASKAAATGLAVLLNTLNDQQDWRNQAALWPQAVA